METCNENLNASIKLSWQQTWIVIFYGSKPNRRQNVFHRARGWQNKTSKSHAGSSITKLFCLMKIRYLNIRHAVKRTQTVNCLTTSSIWGQWLRMFHWTASVFGENKTEFSATAATMSNSILSFGTNNDLSTNRLSCNFGATKSAVVLQRTFSRFAANCQTRAALADTNS